MDDGIPSDKEEVPAIEKDEDSSSSESLDESVSVSPIRKNEEVSSQPVEVEEVQDDWYAKEEKEEAPPDIPKQLDSAANKGAGDTVINGKKKIKDGKPFTKVVVRRLPPSMTKEVFLNQVSPLPAYDYFYFVPATHSSTPEFSRAYVNFVNQDDLFSFTRTFDNYVFIDTKGHEYPAVVEFAPYQRVPKQRNRKPDSLAGTIENDAAFVAFKEELLAQAVDSGAATKQHYFETEINDNGDVEIETTPLVEFVKARKLERARAREERKEERRRKEAERKAARARERQADPPDSPNTTKDQPQSDVKVLQKEKKEQKEKEKKPKTKEEKFGKHGSENRSREFKNKGGKSYKEERLKQAERREERKKKDEQLKEGTSGGGEDVSKSEVADEEPEEKGYEKKKWKYESGKGRTFRRRDDKREGRQGRGGRSRPRGRGEEEEQVEDEVKNEVGKDDAKVDIQKEDKEDNTPREEKKNDTKKAENKQSSKKESKDAHERPESSGMGESQSKTSDPRAERRIRNKDRPSIELYRPGMGKFSRQRLEKEKSQVNNEENCHVSSCVTT